MTEPRGARWLQRHHGRRHRRRRSVAEDKANGLALLRVYGARTEAGRRSRGAAPKGEVTLVGIADPQAQGGGSAVSAREGARRPNARPLDTAPALGFAGAAALDAQGRLAGLWRSSRRGRRSRAGHRRPRLDAGRARAQLARRADYVAPASGQPDGAEAAKASVVRVHLRAESSASARCGYSSFSNFGGRFSMNAAMPSF